MSAHPNSPTASRLAAAVFLAALLCPMAAFAAPVDKYDITPEEHAACDADAVSLCADVTPDEDSLLACMKAKRAQLSTPCAAAFTAGMRRRGIPL